MIIEISVFLFTFLCMVSVLLIRVEFSKANNVFLFISDFTDYIISDIAAQQNLEEDATDYLLCSNLIWKIKAVCKHEGIVGNTSQPW